MIDKLELYQVGGPDGPTFSELEKALGYQAYRDASLISSMLKNRVKTEDPIGLANAALKALEDKDFKAAVRSLNNFIYNFPGTKSKP